MVNPLSLYVDWVRAQPNNASALENLSRTVALIFSDPTNLIKSEGAWALSKVHHAVNAFILERRQTLTSADYSALFLEVIRQLQCLLELTLRFHKGHAVAWDSMVALEGFKCILDARAKREFFLLPWLWTSMVDSLKRSVQSWLHPAAVRVPSSPRGDTNDRVGFRSSTVPLVIPRVVCEPRQRRDRTGETEGMMPISRRARRNVRFTGLDVVGVLVDIFLLVRPLLLVLAGRRAYHEIGQHGAVPLPVSIPRPSEDATTDAPADAPPLDRFAMVRAIMTDSSRNTHFPSRRFWAFFTIVDLLVLFISRLIRRKRVPILHIGEDCGPRVSGESTSGRSGPDQLDSSVPQSTGDNPSGVATQESAGREEAVATPIPTVVSHDTMRIQQVERNLLFNLVRDPFFTVVVKDFIIRHFVGGFVNRIPLLGAIVSFQVSYLLSMQHYSFLYTLGQ